MKDYSQLNILQKIETAISSADDSVSYREFMIADLAAKNNTLKDARIICDEGLLMCEIFDLNLTIAMKHSLRLADIFQFNSKDNAKYVIANRDSDEPRSLINNEIVRMVMDSQLLVKEIQDAMAGNQECDDSTSILTLFDRATQSKAEDLVKKSFDCFKFPYSGILLFTRSNGSTLQHEVELALSSSERNIGFSRRPYIPDGSGMWYDFEEEVCRSFVTTDVVRDLSVAYIREDGTICEMVDRKADDNTIYRNQIPAKYILEMTKGWFNQNDIGIGDKVQLESLVSDD